MFTTRHQNRVSAQARHAKRAQQMGGGTKANILVISAACALRDRGLGRRNERAAQAMI